MRPSAGTASFDDSSFMVVHATATPPGVLALVSAPAHELRFAKVDLALDPPARVVLEVAAPIELVHARALGFDQAELDLVVERLRRPVIAVDLAPMIDSTQAFAMLRALSPQQIELGAVLLLDLVELGERRFDRLPARDEFLDPVRRVLLNPGVLEP